MPSTHAFQQGLRIMQSHIDHAKKPDTSAILRLKKVKTPNKISSKERNEKIHLVQRNTRQPLLCTSYIYKCSFAYDL